MSSQAIINSYTRIRQAMFNFIALYTNVPVVYNEQWATRPRLPYVAFETLTTLGFMGAKDEVRRFQEGTFLIGQRSVGLRIAAIAKEDTQWDDEDFPQVVLESIRWGLRQDAGRAIFRQAGLGILDEGTITDTTEYATTSYERSAIMDWVLSVTLFEEVDEGQICTVEGEGTLTSDSMNEISFDFTATTEEG